MACGMLCFYNGLLTQTASHEPTQQSHLKRRDITSHEQTGEETDTPTKYDGRKASGQPRHSSLLVVGQPVGLHIFSRKDGLMMDTHLLGEPREQCASTFQRITGIVAFLSYLTRDVIRPHLPLQVCSLLEDLRGCDSSIGQQQHTEHERGRCQLSERLLLMQSCSHSCK